MLFRYFSREILAASLLVLVALLALFGFFDLIRELDDLNKGAYRLNVMLAYVALSLPSHAYVLLPAAGLMGTLFALARMAEQSEITVMRSAGLSLAQLALYVAGAGFVIENYVDEAEGVLEKRADGKMAMTRVTLHPRVTCAGDPPEEAAIADLHHRAHEACFIANSVTTEVTVEH